ncbi:hypothetical protein FJP00_04885 [Bacillus safensis]|nr:hypothetical protein [Bacillus safensis]
MEITPRSIHVRGFKRHFFCHPHAAYLILTGEVQRVDKPSHSLSALRAGAHECQIRSAPVLELPRLQRFSFTLKKRQRAKIKIILALCQQSVPHLNR